MICCVHDGLLLVSFFSLKRKVSTSYISCSFSQWIHTSVYTVKFEKQTKMYENILHFTSLFSSCCDSTIDWRCSVNITDVNRVVSLCLRIAVSIHEIKILSLYVDTNKQTSKTTRIFLLFFSNVSDFDCCCLKKTYSHLPPKSHFEILKLCR
jgi:hypothetical protein